MWNNYQSGKDLTFGIIRNIIAFCSDNYRKIATHQRWPCRASKSMRTDLVNAAWIFAGLILLSGFLVLNPFFTIFYTVRVDNDPLTNPIEVVEMAENRIKLGDGRVFSVDLLINSTMQEVMNETGGKVEVVIPDNHDDSFVFFYGKQQSFICGTGRPSYTVKMIPIKVARYERRIIAWGELEEDLTNPDLSR